MADRGRYRLSDNRAEAVVFVVGLVTAGDLVFIGRNRASSRRTTRATGPCFGASRQERGTLSQQRIRDVSTYVVQNITHGTIPKK